MEHMNTEKKTYKRALTIAGSDPSGGAGIQADLKTFSACGCFGTSAIVAVVDENTVGVTGVHPVPVEFVVGQIRSVLDDIGADAVKIGMLHSSELIRAVRQTLGQYAIRNVVLDPVMVATSGDPLLQQEAIATLRDELVPHVRIITPNIPEAELLLGRRIASQEELPEAPANSRATAASRSSSRPDICTTASWSISSTTPRRTTSSNCAPSGSTHRTPTARAAPSRRHWRPSWPTAVRSTRRPAARRSTSPRPSPQARPTASATATVPYTTSSGSGNRSPERKEDKRRRNHPVLRRLSCTLRPSGPNAETTDRGLDAPSRIRPPGHLRSADPVHSWMSPGSRPGPRRFGCSDAPERSETSGP